MDVKRLPGRDPICHVICQRQVMVVMVVVMEVLVLVLLLIK